MKKLPRYLLAVSLCILLIAAMSGCGSIPQETVKPSTAIVSIPPQASITPLPSTTPSPAISYGDPLPCDKVSFKSKSLKKEMYMKVYLPKDYDAKEKYAVLYLIHGYGANEDIWGQLNLAPAAGGLFKSGKVKPYIIVTPDIGNSFGINSAKTTSTSNGMSLGPYEDYIIRDVIGYIDAHYSTVKGREGRYIGGFSMGGYVALHLGMAYPDLFSRIGGHSPAAILSGDTRSDIYYMLYYRKADELKRSPMLLAESADLSHTAIYLDCGTEDRLSRGTKTLYEKLKEKGVQAEYHAFPGGHELVYWMNHVEEYLMFYGAE